MWTRDLASRKGSGPGWFKSISQKKGEIEGLHLRAVRAPRTNLKKKNIKEESTSFWKNDPLANFEHEDALRRVGLGVQTVALCHNVLLGF